MLRRHDVDLTALCSGGANILMIMMRQGITSCSDTGMHVDRHACAEMRVDMCIDMCAGAYKHKCMDMCMDMYMDMCIEMCMDR